MRQKLSIAIALIVISLAIIAVVSKTNTKVELQQLDLKTKQQEIDIIQKQLEANQSELEKAESDKKKLKELEEKNKELQKDLQDAQARKAEKQRVAAEEAQNAVLADAVQPQAVSGDCTTWMSEAGITHPLARDLIQRESGCNHLAVNPSSGACGIPQSLPCSKMGAVNPDGTSAVPPVQQLVWMQNYVMGRYGSWEAAIAHHDAKNWY